MTHHGPTGCRGGRILLLAAVLMLSGCDAVNDLVNRGNDAETFYYLSLGTSLSVGVQPTGSGVPLPTNDGYANQLYDSIKPAFEAASSGSRTLELTKLGCPGETIDDMVNGGSCPYLAGSQLDAAVDFLNDHRGNVYLVTIDMGANEFRNAGCIGATVNMDCVDAVSTQVAMDLAGVLATLRDAAGPDVTIVGMNYYNPYLSSWLTGSEGQTLAVATADAGTVFNGYLATTYQTAGVPMADVYASFQSDDFSTMVATMLPPPNDNLPINVATICEMTWMCEEPPVGPDIHANSGGYGMIAEAFLDALP